MEFVVTLLLLTTADFVVIDFMVTLLLLITTDF
jgi:hypothetical protein